MEERSEKLRAPVSPDDDDDDEPWLMFLHGSGKRKKIQTFCTISPSSPHNKSYIKSIPELRDKKIRGCSHGCWLILVDRRDYKTFTLFNPLVSKAITLPPLEAPEWAYDDDPVNYSCGLTSSPSVDNHDHNNNDENNNPVLVLVRGPFVFSCGVNRKQVWATQRLELEGKKAEVHDSITATCNGVLYTVAHITDNGICTSSLVAIDVDVVNNDDGLKRGLRFELGMPKLPSGSTDYYHRLHYLLESCGVVYEVSIIMRHLGEYQRITSVMVWALDLGNRTWIRVDSLGDRAFFLSNYNSCTWCWASTGGVGGIEGNCVYFMSHDDEVLYMYKLKERSLTPFWPLQNLVTPSECPTWIMPQNQRLSARHGQKPHVTNTLNILEQEIIVEDCDSNKVHTERDAIEKDHDHENLFSLLPTELLASISDNLHFFDYLNFKSTCKSLQSALPVWREYYNNSSSTLPLFMFSDNNNNKGLCKLMDIRQNDSPSMVIPMLSGQHEMFIDYSKNGWLLLGMRTKTLRYFNLFTRAMVDLPPDEDLYVFTSLGFSSSCPTSSDCIIVGFLDLGTLYIAFFQTDDETWGFKELGDDVDFSPGSCCPVYLEGVFYFLDKRGYLGALEYKPGEEFGWRIYDRPNTKDTCFQSHHLVDCGGELLSVLVGYMGSWVQVFRFNRSISKWVQVKSLGDCVLFIGPASSHSAVTRSEDGMRNRIYFPRLRGNGIVFYSLDTCKFHTSGCEDSMKDFHGTKEPLVCCWV